MPEGIDEKRIIHSPTLISKYEEKLHQLLDQLYAIGSEGQDSGATRLLYSEAWQEAQHFLAQVMEQEGLQTAFDHVGNLKGYVAGTNAQLPLVATGSHVDTVAQGGKFDGALGVAAGLLAMAYLQEAFGAPARGMVAVSLCEEEGSRFPLTYWGSGSMTGMHSLKDAAGVIDRDGISLLDAMRAAGFGIEAGLPESQCDFDTFIELHIEQGAVLERTGCQIGIVTSITGQKRVLVTIQGEANHAGTTPMKWRKDAGAAAAAMIMWLEKLAIDVGEPMVATVGRISLSPNIPNVIAGEAVISLDIRHPNLEVLNLFCSQVKEGFASIAEERGLQLEWTPVMDAAPIPMDDQLQQNIENICNDSGYRWMRLPSGAGHDAQIFQPMARTAMIFVPSKDGISHSPLEYTSPEDIVRGFRVLTDMLYKCAYGGNDDE